MNKYVAFLMILLGFYITPSLVAQTIPEFESVPGGVAIVNLNGVNRPNAVYAGNRVMVIGKTDQWKAIIGIPLTAAPGKHKLLIMRGTNKTIKHFDVFAKSYKEQRITIKDDRKVNPLPVDMDRINHERKFIQAAKESWSDIDEVSLELQRPVAGPYSSPFGLRRFFNDQPRKPHSGLDIVAVEGTPIKTAAPGKIVNTGDYFFNGNTVFIDHGQGMLTMYCHMQNITVKEGQSVNSDDVIGTVGQTGRVTGAHLHWSVILNKTMVDPELFISKTK